MYRAIIVAMMLWACVPAYAHEMTPTYPRFEISYVEGVVRTKLRLFNKRSDVQFYEISVYDKDFNPVAFATPRRVLQLPHLSSTQFEVFVRKEDLDRIVYICTESKLQKAETVRTVITSRICSKIQNG
jgi:hypothetical protein